MTTATKQISVRGKEHHNAHEALLELNFSGDRAISLGGRFFTVTEAEFARLESEGVQPTTWHDHHGRIVSVPGRQG